MRSIRLGPEFAVFALFFGIALIEALRHGEWILVALFTALGALFVRTARSRGSRG